MDTRIPYHRLASALSALIVLVTVTACGRSAATSHADSVSETPGSPSDNGGGSRSPVTVAPLPGWPKWLGEANHQISGLAFRDGHLYAVADQSGIKRRRLFSVDLGTDPSSRKVGLRTLCRWAGGPHPDAEGLALDPSTGPPRTALIPLESEADALIEVGFGNCELLASYGPLTGRQNNQGIEGVAVSPDGGTLYLVQETPCTILELRRGSPGPARLVAKVADADSLCDVAYDDRQTTSTQDDRLLLLDRNARRIFCSTLSGRIVGRWDLDRKALAVDPDGFGYTLVSLEALAIESREADGSLLVYAATDTPPKPFPYHRKGSRDKEGLYQRRVGMLYRFRLPPLEPQP